MPDFATMQARIADELARSDLIAQIPRAILSAIQHHERRRFPWNEAAGTFQTVVGQEWYGAADFPDLANCAAVDAMSIRIGGTSWDEVRQRAIAWLEYMADDVTGDPTDFAFYGARLRFYPIPSEVRTVRMLYLRKLPALASGSDTNAWTEDGEELIRLRAKVDLLENVIREAESFNEAARLRAREMEILSAITVEANRRAASGVITAYD